MTSLATHPVDDPNQLALYHSAHEGARGAEGEERMKRVAPGTPLPERLLHYVSVTDDGCWEWQGAIDKAGYGKITIAHVARLAHRISHELFNGPTPHTMDVDHTCFVRACVNPEHLVLLTPSENRARQRSTFSPTCRNGHLRTPANTATRGGYRRCRECDQIEAKNRWIRTKAARA